MGFQSGFSPLKVTDARRDVILAGRLFHRFPWRHLPPTGLCLSKPRLTLGVKEFFINSLERYPRLAGAGHALFCYCSPDLFLHLLLPTRWKWRNGEHLSWAGAVPWPKHCFETTRWSLANFLPRFSQNFRDFLWLKCLFQTEWYALKNIVFFLLKSQSFRFFAMRAIVTN